MNSKWQIHRVGLIDFWYYDEEEFYFLDGRMLLRGANGSGKSVTMQSFIPLLLDGNMRPERLDPFGSKARKMENYLLEEGDGRDERTGYLYMELKRKESEEYVTLGIGMRARRNKKMDSWYFCITDGRRVGKDIYLYKEEKSKITCTMRELRNRIGEGGKVMETQSEYAQCVNKLLFGFETQEEYKELLNLLIQLRTPKLSKDFKPTVINDILSSSLQTLSEDDLRPMSEAIENMDGMKTSLDTLKESISAIRQIEKVYDQYNEIVLYDKALLYTKAEKDCRQAEEKMLQIEENLAANDAAHQQEKERYESLAREEKVLQEERASLADNDAAKLKEQEMKVSREIIELKKVISDKRRQEQAKNEKRLDTEEVLKKQEEKKEEKWSEIEEYLEEMEADMEGVPFDDFAFLKEELLEKREEEYSFDAHRKLLKDYTEKVECGKSLLQEEKAVQERYSSFLQDLDEYQNERNKAERELLQYENQLHEIRQELIEQICKWNQQNEELHPDAEALQEMARRIESYHSDSDYWAIRNLSKRAYDERREALSAEKTQRNWKLGELQKEYDAISKELKQWQDQKEPEPERDAAVIKNRKRLDEMQIPYVPFYKIVDFDRKLDREKSARLEEALLNMGILDALIIAPQYRDQVLQTEEGCCDRYLFTDAEYAKNNLMEWLDIDNPDNDMFLYQNVSSVLSAISAGKSDQAATWIDENGNYRIGVLEGTVTNQYTPCFIGLAAREQYRLDKITELQQLAEEKRKEIETEKEKIAEIQGRLKKLEEEWNAFPKDHDLKIAAKDYEIQEEKLKTLNEKIQQQKQRVEAERKKLDEVRLRVQEACQKCYLKARLDLFEEVQGALKEYTECLSNLQICHKDYINTLQYKKSQELYLEEIEQDLDDIRYELGRSITQQKQKEAELTAVGEQLKLTDYEKIKERLDYCIERLSILPQEKEASARKRGELESEYKTLEEKRAENQKAAEKLQNKKEWLAKAFEQEYILGYVMDLSTLEKVTEKEAAKVCSQFAGKFGSDKQSDLLGKLQAEYHKNRGYLLEYQMTLKTLFQELDDQTSFLEMGMKRIDISAKYHGTAVKFKELISILEENERIQSQLIRDKDKELFEDILANTVGKKIRARIQASKRWVEKMNDLMESMKTSSGLKLSLRWKNKRADKEEQLDTKALVDLLQKDAEIMRPEEIEQLSGHFRSKIAEARKEADETANMQSFHAIMREVLDYRKWFEFQLECQKTGEKKRELTDRVFFTFSGGEKAMAMYVPLFSAVVAKYAGARSDAPRLISLDEAFAGVDEMNIRDMFRLMVEFDFNFMINSQILWGDYETVPALAIYQLVRPENAKFVTVIRYTWNGNVKQMITKKDVNEIGENQG